MTGIIASSSMYIRFTGTGWAPKFEYGLEIQNSMFGIALRDG